MALGPNQLHSRKDINTPGDKKKTIKGVKLFCRRPDPFPPVAREKESRRKNQNVMNDPALTMDGTARVIVSTAYTNPRPPRFASILRKRSSSCLFLMTHKEASKRQRTIAM